MESPSVIFYIVFFTILLLVGFGFNGWSLSAIILLFTAGLSFLMVAVDIGAVQENWKDRRCELDIVLTSFLYKPKTDSRSTMEFVNENFDFCMKQTIQDFLKVLMTPLYGALGDELKVTEGLIEVMNTLRTLKANMMNSFLGFLNPMYDRFIVKF